MANHLAMVNFQNKEEARARLWELEKRDKGRQQDIYEMKSALAQREASLEMQEQVGQASDEALREEIEDLKNRLEQQIVAKEADRFVQMEVSFAERQVLESEISQLRGALGVAKERRSQAELALHEERVDFRENLDKVQQEHAAELWTLKLRLEAEKTKRVKAERLENNHVRRLEKALRYAEAAIFVHRQGWRAGVDEVEEEEDIRPGRRRQPPPQERGAFGPPVSSSTPPEAIRKMSSGAAGETALRHSQP